MMRSSLYRSVPFLLSATLAGGCLDLAEDPSLGSAAHALDDDLRIVGGNPADEGEYPFAAAIINEEFSTSSIWCGGSLIAPGFVLSAKHCFDSGEQPEDFRIVLGRVSLSGSGGRDVDVRSIRLHPDDSVDLAVLELAEPVPYAPVTLDWRNRTGLTDGRASTIVGWGDTTQGGTTSDLLLEVNVQLMGIGDACNDTTDYDNVEDDEICIGVPAGGMDSCQGDSGGPALIREGGDWVQIGTVFRGIGCAQPDKPGVYQLIRDEYDWINDAIGNSRAVAAYRNAGYTGTRQRFRPGLYRAHHLSRAVGNDTITSLIVPSGMRALLCSENGGWGTCREYARSVYDLPGDIDNRTSFVQVHDAATVYTGKSRSGTAQALEPGVHQAADLDIVGNDTISSLYISPGLLARVCAENGGWGTCDTFQGVVNDIGSALDNRASFVDVQRGVTVFRNHRFGSTRQTFGPGIYKAADLDIVGNDTITSLIAAPGVTVRLCSENGGWGTCREFSGKVPYVGDDLNNRTSFIEVSLGVTVYRETGFQGVSQTLVPGIYRAADLDVVGNDSVTSLIVPPGYSARLCSENDGSGTCQSFGSDTAHVGKSLDNRTSYIWVTRVFRPIPVGIRR